MCSTPRPQSQIDQVADAWLDRVVDLVPTVGTYIGRTEGDDRYGDYSPAGADAYAAAARESLVRIEKAEPVDDVDRVTQADLARELRIDIELHEAGWHLRDLNVLESPAQEIRQVYDLMPTDTEEDWSTYAKRLSGVPAALEGYTETLREGLLAGTVPAVRQVHEVADQVRGYAKPGGFFDQAIAGAVGSADLPAALRRDLTAGADGARSAYARLARFLDGVLAPRAGERDAVGRDLYALHSRRFLGAEVDLDETYEWGLDELARVRDEQEKLAREIRPGASVDEAVAFLERDITHKLVGAEALREWMQATADRAVEELGRTHFDIPEPVRRIECMIAPTTSGEIYYTGPSDDFSRPGRMWWSVPEGVETFDTWRELTTVYHEGVPGHHLQIGQAVVGRDKLNSWRRLLAGTSGHAEGWALYAERLMEELGYLDDPAARFGMLDGQRMRAARVVLDIGVHLEKPRPDGAGPWSAAYALDFMRRNVNMDDAFVQFEVNRYLGWPGQAPAYKVGQRIWEQLRDEVAAREGDAFSLKEFHRRALDLGGVGLDTLRTALLA
ncbi:MAG TPA: DUF885 domain-containing protein [Candidatus Microbacterium stercoravium]|uniref:DUF885 domain-containing protein n=1 Tax=Candidatus Microbacterium stercoravium TaxID=2838697 RepID=A0A9D2H2X6_9MICO|nr:DUF885 domain-containing protein [Candidatus Microbacterium stercoravium]